MREELTRVLINEKIYLTIGPQHLKSAYQMSYESLLHLTQRISLYIQVDSTNDRVNSPIPDSIQYFAGISLSGIASLFGIKNNDVYRSIGHAVAAFNIVYPPLCL